MSDSNNKDRKHTLVEGKVKWFDSVKGFGFIVADAVEHDILLHGNVLRNFGQSTVIDGANITIMVQETARGVQASEVISLKIPQGIPPSLGEGTVSPEYISSLPLEPARIKWFDREKGFGFGNVFGCSEDVFIHIDLLRMSGLADLQVGEAVCLKIIEGERGKMAAQVMPWDHASRVEP